MCGIAGSVAFTPDVRPRREMVAEMSRCIAQRGPDGEGLWSADDGSVILAHRRLAIIDLSTGDQPKHSDDGNISLVFNGEIYNYRELRAELQRDGCVFHTASDTEVLLRLVEREGERCVDRLRGMFAFAAWDARRRRLILARDRVGKKPLYWARRDGVLHFASSLEAIRRAMGGHPDVDLVSLERYLTLGWVPSPRTIWDGISKLEAATVMVADASGERTHCYWDLGVDETRFEGSFDEAVETLEGILQEATRIRLRSDVPLGIFLSGGIDSSLVTAMAMREDAALQTYSVRFDDPTFDESAHAAAIARHLGAQHHVIDAEMSSALDLLPTLVRQFGEPFADSSAIPQAMLARKARQHVTVALGGDGGDEGFAGYEWYRTFRKVRRLGRMIPAAAAGATSRLLAPAGAGSTLARQRGRLARGLGALQHEGDAGRYAALRTLLSGADAALLFDGALQERLREGGDASGIIAPYEAAHGSPLRKMRWTDIRTYLADCLLPKVDVATMAMGLEARAPLLDQEVLRFALTLPDEYVEDARGGKRILRALLARHVPPQLFERPKQGFTPPVTQWLRGAMRPRVEALPRAERLRSLGVLRADGIQRMVDEHMAGVRDHADRLYALLILDDWLGSVGRT